MSDAGLVLKCFRDRKSLDEENCIHLWKLTWHLKITQLNWTGISSSIHLHFWVQNFNFPGCIFNPATCEHFIDSWPKCNSSISWGHLGQMTRSTSQVFVSSLPPMICLFMSILPMFPGKPPGSPLKDIFNSYWNSLHEGWEQATWLDLVAAASPKK